MNIPSPSPGEPRGVDARREYSSPTGLYTRPLLYYSTVELVAALTSPASVVCTFHHYKLPSILCEIHMRKTACYALVRPLDEGGGEGAQGSPLPSMRSQSGNAGS